jgi:hypothetical protein
LHPLQKGSGTEVRTFSKNTQPLQNVKKSAIGWEFEDQHSPLRPVKVAATVLNNYWAKKWFRHE